jgi:hypothetical protein
MLLATGFVLLGAGLLLVRRGPHRRTAPARERC